MNWSVHIMDYKHLSEVTIEHFSIAKDIIWGKLLKITCANIWNFVIYLINGLLFSSSNILLFPNYFYWISYNYLPFIFVSYILYFFASLCAFLTNRSLVASDLGLIVKTTTLFCVLTVAAHFSYDMFNSLLLLLFDNPCTMSLCSRPYHCFVYGILISPLR